MKRIIRSQWHSSFIRTVALVVLGVVAFECPPDALPPDVECFRRRADVGIFGPPIPRAFSLKW